MKAMYNTSDVGYWDDYNDPTEESKPKIAEDCNDCELVKIDEVWTCERCGKQEND